MWSFMKNRVGKQCQAFRDRLERDWDLDLPSEHLASCADCRKAADSVIESRRLLAAIPRQQPASEWFVPRVMAAIATRERELGRIGETWTAVPKLAARLTWATAFALLVASTWLYEAPQKNQPASSGSETMIESLFDNPQPQLATKDDILLSLAAQK
jgi:hypothetical protein